MSHGSKKWIKDYRGKIKRSNNRTKIDYYAGLKCWDVWYTRSYLYGNKVQTKDFCPQCKHVQKAILNDMERYRAAEKKVRAEWLALYGDRYWVEIGGKHVYFYIFFRDHKDYPGPLWHYDFRSYLCYKHERMYEQERQMWRKHVNGEKSHYGDVARDNYRSYRAKMKQAMRDERYDDLRPYKHDWLD